MLAYKNDTKLKEELLSEVESHRKQDQILKGTYGTEDDGKWKGCAVGCSLHSLGIKLGKNLDTADHTLYEKELGIPEIIAYLEDDIFEHLPEKRSQTWPGEFLAAINPGADLSLAYAKFMVWQWEDKKVGLSQIKEIQEDKETMQICEDVVTAYKKVIDGVKVTTDEWDKLYIRANKVYQAWAWAGAGARASGAGARAWARASGAGARAGARAGASGAGAGARAWAWASGAGAGASGAGAWARAIEKEYVLMADKLLEILKDTK